MQKPTQKVYKVVLTGGPCSGKTTALTTLKERFGDKFIIYSIPEVATMTITSVVNIIPNNFTPKTHKILTQAIIQTQINLETYFEKIASFQKKPVILICDRGVMDNFAYCSKEVKEKIL
jgi:thymidylate kinase